MSVVARWSVVVEVGGFVWSGGALRGGRVVSRVVGARWWRGVAQGARGGRVVSRVVGAERRDKEGERGARGGGEGRGGGGGGGNKVFPQWGTRCVGGVGVVGGAVSPRRVHVMSVVVVGARLLAACARWRYAG